MKINISWAEDGLVVREIPIRWLAPGAGPAAAVTGTKGGPAKLADVANGRGTLNSPAGDCARKRRRAPAGFSTGAAETKRLN